MFNWHLAKVTSHGLEPSVHLEGPGPGQRPPLLLQQHTGYSDKGFVCEMMTTNPITSTLVLQSLQAPLRPLAGFVPPVSQDKFWSSVWKEGKDRAGTVTLLDRFSSLMLVVPLICFYLLVATDSYQYVQFPYQIFLLVV